jgi:ABC-type glycerol-3-phosphate transport system substrate-binding protein
MKVLLGIILMSGSFITNAGFIDSMLTSDFNEFKPDIKYKLEVYGYDARVYEFTPKSAINTTCVLIATGGTSNAIQMECFDKKD